MGKIKFIIFFLLVYNFSFGQESGEDIIHQLQFIDSIENSFNYEKGEIALKGGIGKITIPEGFKYLNPEQAEYILTDIWGNPKEESMTLGFILRDDQLIISDTGYVFNIEYEEIGYVEDDDAEDIDYDELLETMQKESKEYNIERKKMGYESIEFVGWASKPYYDKDKKILHWAKELKFGDSQINTLNYNIRVLGRKGILIINAVSSMPNLSIVQNDIPKVLDIIKFNEGYQYDDFDPDVDNIAAWSIGGLVAGKVLAKVGFFALIVKFWKIIALAVAGFFGAFWKKFKNKKENKVGI